MSSYSRSLLVYEQIERGGGPDRLIDIQRERVRMDLETSESVKQRDKTSKIRFKRKSNRDV